MIRYLDFNRFGVVVLAKDFPNMGPSESCGLVFDKGFPTRELIGVIRYTAHTGLELAVSESRSDLIDAITRVVNVIDDALKRATSERGSASSNASFSVIELASSEYILQLAQLMFVSCFHEYLCINNGVSKAILTQSISRVTLEKPTPSTITDALVLSLGGGFAGTSGYWGVRILFGRANRAEQSALRAVVLIIRDRIEARVVYDRTGKWRRIFKRYVDRCCHIGALPIFEIGISRNIPKFSREGITYSLATALHNHLHDTGSAALEGEI